MLTFSVEKVSIFRKTFIQTSQQINRSIVTALYFHCTVAHQEEQVSSYTGPSLDDVMSQSELTTTDDDDLQEQFLTFLFVISDSNDENKNGNIPDKSEPSSDKKAKKKGGKSTFLSSSNSNLLANVSPIANGNAISQNGTISKAKVVEVAPAVAPPSLPNFVKENFVGKSVMGTRCLECETSTYRYSDLPTLQ